MLQEKKFWCQKFHKISRKSQEKKILGRNSSEQFF